MTIELNHLIVFSRDKSIGAAFLSETLGLPAPKPSGPFLAVTMDNSVTLDYIDADREIIPQHLAFLVEASEFESIRERVNSGARPYWADPYHRREGQIYEDNEIRGFYFEDPSGHNLEVMTRVLNAISGADRR